MHPSEYAGADVPVCASGWEAGAEVELRRISRDYRAELDRLRVENRHLQEEIRRLRRERDEARERPAPRPAHRPSEWEGAGEPRRRPGASRRGLRRSGSRSARGQVSEPPGLQRFPGADGAIPPIDPADRPCCNERDGMSRDRTLREGRFHDHQ